MKKHNNHHIFSLRPWAGKIMVYACAGFYYSVFAYRMMYVRKFSGWNSRKCSRLSPFISPLRDNGNFIFIKGNVVDNRRVVSFNPFLCRKYNVHINYITLMYTLVSSFIESVKYFFEYVYKCHDAVVLLAAPLCKNTDE